VRKIENRFTFGEVMDNIIVACFFDSQCTSKLHSFTDWSIDIDELFNNTELAKCYRLHYDNLNNVESTIRS